MAVTVHIEQYCIVINSNQTQLTEQEAMSCVNMIKAQVERRPLVIFNFSQVEKTTEIALRTLTRAVSEVTQNEAKVAVVVQQAMKIFISSAGLDRLFPCFNTLDEAIQFSRGLAAGENSQEFLNTTLEAVSYTLKVATNTDVKNEKPYIRSDEAGPSVDIGATVGIVSTPFNGTLILAFPIKTYLGLMSRLLGKECTEIDATIRDGAAELLNIILGQARTTLNDKGYAIKQAIPTVVYGTNLQIFNFSSTPSVIIPHSSDVGSFYVELTTRTVSHNV
ncbi:MAG: chemotaxis protein CheX [Bdellovibrionota bacterium]